MLAAQVYAERGADAYDTYLRAYEFISSRASADTEGLLLIRLARRIQGLRLRRRIPLVLAFRDVACRLPRRSRLHYHRATTVRLIETEATVE